MEAKESTDSIPVVVLVCQHFIKDAMAAISELELKDVACAAFPARCGRPPVKEDEIRGALAQAAPGPESRTVVFGGCCINGIQSFLSDSDRVSVCYMPQCFEMVASKSFVENLMADGAFLTTPGWLAQWRQWIERAGFNRQIAREYFAESMERIVLLDTATDAAAVHNLETFAAFVDRPALQISVGIDTFKIFVHRWILSERQEAARQRARKDRQQYHQEQADFAMTLDLLSQLPMASTEKEAFASTASVFTMLFAPETIVYAEKENDLEPRAWLLYADAPAVDVSGRAPGLPNCLKKTARPAAGST